MLAYRSKFVSTIANRGYLHQCTNLEALDAQCAAASLTAYVGYDCTAPSLHVGNLISIMMLRRWQKAGHRPIVLMGGGTTKIGDPSGKDEGRQLLNEAAIAANMASIRNVFSRFIELDNGKGNSPTAAIIVNNADWLEQLAYIDFLRDYGRHFSINRMLTFDSVRLRLDREQPLTFLEFNYMILQAYDFVELARRHACRLQMGGSDQWGNIVNGVELGRRTDSLELFGLTTPLLTTASGAKMGKTEAGAVWLNADMLSPYDYWQFWRNTEDDDVARFLRLFTDLPLAEIARLDTLEGSEINDAKKILADAATTLCHSAAAAARARQTSESTFEQGSIGDALPSIEISRSELKQGVSAFDLLRRTGLASSNGEARRLIKGGGARLNDAVIAEELTVVTMANISFEGVIKLSAGRKRHALVLPI
ncbi:MAG: tyrosine--tRNA ligase [Rhodospirillales bacterium]|jgi:tyrosyl-tRNA synthetase